METDDIRAGVAAGILDEAQAAQLIALADQRQGRRADLTADDEPFELFRGFSEIFVTAGIGLLFAGLILLLIVFESLLVLGVATAAMCWFLAEYFTRKRRMVLPSLALCIGCAGAVFGVTIGLLSDLVDQDSGLAITLCFVAGGVAAGAFHWRFGLPFALFVAGGYVLMAALALMGILSDASALDTFADGPGALLDIARQPSLALTTLVVGLGAFILAMRYDLRDPHRISRLSACGFWLHLIAGPAIVNTVAMTLFNANFPGAEVVLLLFVLILAFVAVVIDRRSFLLTGIVYLGALLWIAVEGEEGLGAAAVFLILGVGILGLGAGWTQLRQVTMSGLPDFPGKDRLPPYRKDAE